MADTELGELYGPATASRGAVSGWVGMIGAATSLAMVIGLGVWGYRLLVRDVNGIPVVRALEGPMRIQPTDPGGERMAHQGLAVNQVAAAGEAGEISEEVTLAPQAPGLLDHDLPRADLSAAPMPDFSHAADVAVAEVLETGDAEAADAAIVDPDAVPASPVAALAGADEVAAAGAIPVSVPGVRRSPRPPARPAAIERAVAATVPVAAAEAAAVEAAVEIEAGTLPVGSRLVQLGAFETKDLARAEWGKMALKFSDVMRGKLRVIQEASSGGQTFFRLRVAGFSDLADARRFCATLAADKTKPLCVPVATR
jgi:hypothetical protein